MATLFQSAIVRNHEKLSESPFSHHAIVTHPEFLDPIDLQGWTRSEHTRKYYLPIDIVLHNRVQPDKKDWRGEFSRELYNAAQSGNADLAIELLQPVFDAVLNPPESDHDKELRTVKDLLRTVGHRHGQIRSQQWLDLVQISVDQDHFKSDFWNEYSSILDTALAMAFVRGHGMLDTLLNRVRTSTTLLRLANSASNADHRKDAQVTSISQGGSDVMLPSWSVRNDLCDESTFDLVAGSMVLGRDKKLSPGDYKRLKECRCSSVQYYVTDLLELREKTHSYTHGDLAYIENVAGREKRIREHFYSEEQSQETEKELAEEKRDKRDHSVTNREEFYSELVRKLDESKGGSANSSFTYNAKPYKFHVGGDVNFNKSRSNALTSKQEEVNDIITSVVSELNTNKKTRTTTRLTSIESEKNKHVFKNAGDVAISTQYFFVDQVKEARLYGYGKRLMVEAFVANPAGKYLLLEEEKITTKIDKRFPDYDETYKKPDAPAEFTLTVEQITSSKLDNIIETYKLENVPPEPQLNDQTIDFNFQDSTTRKSPFMLPTQMLSVPVNHVATSMELSEENSRFHTRNTRYIKVTLGDKWMRLVPGNSDKTFSHLDALEGSHDIAVTLRYTKLVDVTVSVNIVPKSGVMAAWKRQILGLAKESHDQTIILYHEELKEWKAAKQQYQEDRNEYERALRNEVKFRHPFYNREIEAAEIKREMIGLLCGFTKNEGSRSDDALCSKTHTSSAFTHSNVPNWYFWDRCFDWQYMAFVLSDYFWNSCDEWVQRFDPEESDPQFKSFIRAGYCRVMVPVAPEMDAAFLWYMASKEVWEGEGQPPMDPQDEKWRNVVYELRAAKESSLTQRKGKIVDVDTCVSEIVLKGSDLYWDAFNGAVDLHAIEEDLDREISLNGDLLHIASIEVHPQSPPFNVLNSGSMWWLITLDKEYRGSPIVQTPFVTGAKALAPPIRFNLPTNLIWAAQENKCLPIYPILDCEEESGCSEESE